MFDRRLLVSHSQIVVFGGARCSSGGNEDKAEAATAGSDAEPVELNDLLLFDPDMLKWFAAAAVSTTYVVDTTVSPAPQYIPFSRLHPSTCLNTIHSRNLLPMTLFSLRIIVPRSFGPAPPPRAFHAAVSAGSCMVLAAASSSP